MSINDLRILTELLKDPDKSLVKSSYSHLIANKDVAKTTDEQRALQFIKDFTKELDTLQEIYQNISSINIATSEALITFILDFPPEFYDTLWQHVTLANPVKVFDNLAEIIKAGYFTSEQKQALTTAIAKHYQRFNLPPIFEKNLSRVFRLRQ